MRNFSNSNYSAEQLAFFAEYRAQRAAYRPEGCTEHAMQCWVVAGPPALCDHGCLGCHALPRSRPLRWMPD